MAEIIPPQEQNGETDDNRLSMDKLNALMNNSVHMTAEEWNELSGTPNPDNNQRALALHEQFGDTAVITVDGEARVVDTSLEDFGTTLREETNALQQRQAEVARDDELSVELEEVLDTSRDIGEKAVEEVVAEPEVKDPVIEQAAQSAASMLVERRDPAIHFGLSEEKKEAMRQEAARPSYFDSKQLTEVNNIVGAIEDHSRLLTPENDTYEVKSMLTRNIVAQNERLVQQAREKKISPDEYVLQTSLLLGAMPNPDTIGVIEGGLVPSGVYSQEDLHHLHENMGHLNDLLRRGASDEDKWDYYRYLDDKARQELKQHDNTPTRKYLETVGLMLGFGSQFGDFDRRYAATRGALEALQRAKKPRDET